jgi:hypothetical protein
MDSEADTELGDFTKRIDISSLRKEVMDAEQAETKIAALSEYMRRRQEVHIKALLNLNAERKQDILNKTAVDIIRDILEILKSK